MKVLPDTCFGLSTAQGLIEFKCESNTSKQNLVHGVQNLLQQVDVADQVGHMLEIIKLNIINFLQDRGCIKRCIAKDFNDGCTEKTIGNCTEVVENQFLFLLSPDR